jgi:hypothetical protein
MNKPSSCVQWSLFFLCFLLPLAECSCKPKVQVMLGSFVVSLQAKNQFSKPSTEMELVQWPRAARSTTCDQDRCVCVCVILHISSWRYGHIVTLLWCINDDYNLCVCVILHITSWRYGPIVTLFWCINDDCNLCAWFCISRDMLLWLSLCSTIFCMIYLLTCKAWRTSRRGLAKSNSNSQFGKSTCFSQDSWCKLDLDLASEIMPDCWRSTLFLLGISF